MKTFCPTNPPMRGAGAEALQRALAAAGLYGGKPDGIWGAASGDAARRAKWRLGYPRSRIDQCGGEFLLDLLERKRQLPLAYRARRRARGFGLTRAERQRAGMVAFCAWSVAHEPQITYVQERPMRHARKGLTRALPWRSDCSEHATTAALDAGAPDPNGLGFNGSGWTGTILDHGETIPLAQAKPGDLVVWGAHPGHHVAVVVDTSDRADPKLCSHGQDRGPLYISLSAETKAQGRPWVVKRFIRD